MITKSSFLSGYVTVFIGETGFLVILINIIVMENEHLIVGW